MTKDNLSENELDKLDLDPKTNSKVITIMCMPDGNYRGFMQKNGKLHQTRQADPLHVLQMMLTSK